MQRKSLHVSFFFPLLQLFSLCRLASETDWMKCSCGRNFSETLVLCMVMCTSIRDCVHFNQETASKFAYQVSVIQVHHGGVNFQHNGVAEQTMLKIICVICGNTLHIDAEKQDKKQDILTQHLLMVQSSSAYQTTCVSETIYTYKYAYAYVLIRLSKHMHSDTFVYMPVIYDLTVMQHPEL